MPPEPKPPAVEVRGPDGRFQNGSIHHRGPDRKPRKLTRILILRAVVAALPGAPRSAALTDEHGEPFEEPEEPSSHAPSARPPDAAGATA